MEDNNSNPSTLDAARTDHVRELRTINQDIQSIKSKFHERASRRGKLTSPQIFLERLGERYVDWEDPTQRQAAKEVERLVATALLDASTTLPVSVASLHKQLLLSPQSAHYQQWLQTMGHRDLQRVTLQLGLQCNSLALAAMDVNGSQHMFITDLQRPTLCETTGVEDPIPKATPPSPLPLPSIPPPAPPPGQFPLDLNLVTSSMGPPPFAPFPPNPAGPGMGPPGAPLGMPPLGMGPPGLPPPAPPPGPPPGSKRMRLDGDLSNLIQFKTVKNRDRMEKGEELLELLDKPTLKEAQHKEQFKTVGGTAIREQCPHLTKEDCRAANNSPLACPRLHHRKVLYPWTDESLGSCSFLNTCRNRHSCKHIHYELDPEPDVPGEMARAVGVPAYLKALKSPQWINCDVRNFDMRILGKFGVIMTDPPWEIHQDLPYGTMMDDEMRKLNIGCLQDEGVIFVWVTGRAMELGRECLAHWGYDRVDELIWVKTNQLQRLIRTGRTGHWLNHSKEHCLVGVKGKPELNKYVDTDVVVSEVRETSRKPDEMYPLLERLSPGTRKLEVFARQHNVRPGWVSLGNQLDGVWIVDEDMKHRYEGVYGPVTNQPPKKVPPM